MISGGERGVHRLFVVSLVLKGVDAALEIVAGLVMWRMSADALTGPVLRWARKELAVHPSEVVATYLQNAAANFSIDTKTFAALYLLAHGAIKLLLVIGLLRDKAWAYPTAIVAFVAFIVYQVHRYTFTHSPMLLVLTAFDIVVLVLVWHEYRARQSARPAAEKA